MPPHICACLQLMAHQEPSRAICSCQGRTVTGPEMLRRVVGLKEALEGQLGLQIGDVALLLAPNTEHFLEGLLACAAAGVIVAPLNTRWSPQEAAASAARLRPTMILAAQECVHLAQGIVHTLPDLRAVVWLGPPPHHREPTRDSLQEHSAEDLIHRHRPQGKCLSGGLHSAISEIKQPADGRAVVCFTSGTSGASKGAIVSHAALVGQSLAKIVMAGYQQGDTYLHAAPLFHIGGLSYALAVLAAGARHVFLPKFTGSKMLEAIQREKVTATILVPALMEDLATSAASSEPMPNVRSIVVGAGRPSLRQLEGCQRLFPNATIHSAYGMTEAASTIAWRLLCSPGHRPDLPDGCLSGAHRSASNCVGSPGALTEVVVMAAPGREAGAGEEGEIHVRGFHVMSGYWGQPEETSATLQSGGWLVTGDLGCTDTQGRLWLTGRKKDVVKSGGENVHATEVEGVLVAHKGIQAAAVVGVPDQALGERVACLLVLTKGWSWSSSASMRNTGAKSTHCVLSLGDVQEHCAGMGLSRYKLPRVAWGSLQPLPANALGKVQKRAVREVLELHLAGGGAERLTRSRM